jgi:hypothetical protein
LPQGDCTFTEKLRSENGTPLGVQKAHDADMATPYQR